MKELPLDTIADKIQYLTDEISNEFERICTELGAGNA